MGSINPHVALLSSPGIGHLIPILELGHRLASIFGLRVTVFSVTTDASTVESQLDREFSAYKDILTIVLLPPVDLSSLTHRSNMAPISRIFEIMRRSLQALRSELSSMESRPTALVADMFGVDAFAVADEFRMLKYVFFPNNAWYLAVISYLPYLDRIDEDDHVKLHNPLKVPGCESVRFEDTLNAFSNRHDQALFDCYKSMGIASAGCDGVLMNTWEALEPKTLRALRDPATLGQFLESTCIYSIGPLVRPARSMESQDMPGTNKVLEWMDMQPHESVLYVSFGSAGTLSSDQLTELAWGLEGSGHRFVWVVRPPSRESSSGSHCQLGDRTDETPEYLPDGFVTRTRDTGLVVPTWAPQSDILAHPSVGGFLSHCGWNSTLESILSGLPIIAWPLYAEQKMNATMLAEQLGTAVKPSKLPSSGLIRRDEIEAMVRRVMDKEGDEGKQLRRRAQELKCSAEEAIRKGGSSRSMLSQFAGDCNRVKTASATSEVHEPKHVSSSEMASSHISMGPNV